MAFGGFDNDDGVVNHQSDRQHQAEERKCVQRKPEDWKERECADERDRNGEHGNERRAPALQKDKNDDEDKNQRNDERAHDVLHAFRNSERGVEGNRIVQIRGKGRLELLHEFEHAFFVIERV